MRWLLVFLFTAGFSGAMNAADSAGLSAGLPAGLPAGLSAGLPSGLSAGLPAGLADTLQRPAPINTEEAFHRLSTNQLIRLSALLDKDSVWNAHSDSIVGFFHSLNRGYSRDSALLWYEEGGVAGSILRAEQKIKEMPFLIATEAYNYCGDISSLDFSYNWYAWMRPTDNEDIVVGKSAKVEAVLSKVKLGKKMEFDLRHNRGEGALFLFGSPVPLDSNRTVLVPSSTLSKGRMMPGAEISLHAKDGEGSDVPWILYATGGVVKRKKCPELHQYSLIVSATIDQRDVLLEQDIAPLLMDSTSCGPVELYWFGDVLNDGKPDALFAQELSDGRLRLILMMSDGAPEGTLWRRAADWLLTECNE